METEPENEANATDNLVATIKPFLFGVGFIAFLMIIWVLLPMFLTYLSEGDVRPPSQIHPTDSEMKSSKTVYAPDKTQ